MPLGAFHCSNPLVCRVDFSDKWFLKFPEMYGPPHDCKEKAKVAINRSAQMYSAFGGGSSLLAMMRVALRVLPDKRDGLGRPFSGAGFEHAVGDCSFVLAIQCRPRWEL